MKLLLRTTAIVALFAIPLVDTIACTNSQPVDADPFDNFQDCWNEHNMVENFSVQRAIEICCIDHPIGSADANTVCGDTAATCTTYVTANLSATSAAASDISTACADYVVDRAG